MSFDYLELDDKPPVAPPHRCCPDCGEPVRTPDEAFCHMCGARTLGVELELASRAPVPAAPATPVPCCPHCGTPLHGDETACAVCAAALVEAPQHVSHLSHRVPQQVDPHFCPTCGAYCADEEALCHDCQTPRPGATHALRPHPVVERVTHQAPGTVCNVCGAFNETGALSCHDCMAHLPPAVEVPAPSPPVAPHEAPHAPGRRIALD